MSRLCHDSMTRVSRGTCAAPAAAGPRLSSGGGGWPRPCQCQAQHSAHWAVPHTASGEELVIAKHTFVHSSPHT